MLVLGLNRDAIFHSLCHSVPLQLSNDSTTQTSLPGCIPAHLPGNMYREDGKVLREAAAILP